MTNKLKGSKEHFAKRFFFQTVLFNFSTFYTFSGLLTNSPVNRAVLDVSIFLTFIITFLSFDINTMLIIKTKCNHLQ